MEGELSCIDAFLSELSHLFRISCCYSIPPHAKPPNMVACTASALWCLLSGGW